MKSSDWLTPPEWIKALGPFDCDPACPHPMPWETATRMIHAEGLQREWTGRVWLNPPFGSQAAAWLRKLRDHGNGIGLIPARTETKMFYESVWGHADSVCFVKGRPHFYRPDGTRAPFNSGAPIALVAYGRQNTKALNRAALGIVVAATFKQEIAA